MNLNVLKRSRREPRIGDIFVFQVRGFPFGYGRVVNPHTPIGGGPDGILIYVYNAFSSEKIDIPELSRDHLLIPPQGINQLPWTRGYFETVLNKPLAADDVLPVHCFLDPRYEDETYCNEYRERLPFRSEPCGFYALGSYRTFDDEVSEALGIELARDDE